MNEALRLLRKLVRKWGYDLKKSEQYVLRPVPNLDKLAADLSVRSAKHALDGEGPSSTTRLDHLTIYVRTCLRADRNVNTRPRMAGANEEENALRCLWSLIRSANHAASQDGDQKVHVIGLDDRSDTSFVEKLQRLFEALNCTWELKQTDTQGQGPSLHQQFDESRQAPGLVYFVEDDYLHEHDAVQEMWSFYRQVHNASGGHCVIYPQEHKTLYESHYPSYILAGQNRRWRTMSDATHTFFTHGDVVNTYWHYFENTKFVGIRKKRHLGVEKNTTNKLYNHIPGFSPMPAVAIHLQYEDLLPPFFDWQRLWDENEDRPA